MDDSIAESTGESQKVLDRADFHFSAAFASKGAALFASSDIEGSPMKGRARVFPLTV